MQFIKFILVLSTLSFSYAKSAETSHEELKKIRETFSKAKIGNFSAFENYKAWDCKGLSIEYSPDEPITIQKKTTSFELSDESTVAEYAMPFPIAKHFPHVEKLIGKINVKSSAIMILPYQVLVVETPKGLFSIEIKCNDQACVPFDLGLSGMYGDSGSLTQIKSLSKTELIIENSVKLSSDLKSKSISSLTKISGYSASEYLICTAKLESFNTISK